MARATEDAGAAVTLGNVSVDLKVAVERKDVRCALTFRGSTVTVVFAESGRTSQVSEVQLPPGSNTQIKD